MCKAKKNDSNASNGIIVDDEERSWKNKLILAHDKQGSQMETEKLENHREYKISVVLFKVRSLIRKKKPKRLDV
jgi:hypothetical protein